MNRSPLDFLSLRIFGTTCGDPTGPIPKIPTWTTRSFYFQHPFLSLGVLEGVEGRGGIGGNGTGEVFLSMGAKKIEIGKNFCKKNLGQHAKPRPLPWATMANPFCCSLDSFSFENKCHWLYTISQYPHCDIVGTMSTFFLSIIFSTECREYNI